MGEGEAEEKAFQEYSDWCTETTRNKGFEIKTATLTQGRSSSRTWDTKSSTNIWTCRTRVLCQTHHHHRHLHPQQTQNHRQHHRYKRISIAPLLIEKMYKVM